MTMTEIFDFWRNGNKLQKTIAVIAFITFFLSVAVTINRFYIYLLKPDPVHTLELDFVGIKSGEKLEEFLNNNNGKIARLNIFYNSNLFITSSIEGGEHDLLTTYSDKPELKFFYFCYPEGLEKIKRYGNQAKLGPIDCLEEDLIISGDQSKYRFNRTAGTYFLDGHFFIEFVHMAQGHKFYNLKAIHPSEIANYIAEHQ